MTWPPSVESHLALLLGEEVRQRGALHVGAVDEEAKAGAAQLPAVQHQTDADPDLVLGEWNHHVLESLQWSGQSIQTQSVDGGCVGSFLVTLSILSQPPSYHLNPASLLPR